MSSRVLIAGGGGAGLEAVTDRAGTLSSPRQSLALALPNRIDACPDVSEFFGE